MLERKGYKTIDVWWPELAHILMEVCTRAQVILVNRCARADAVIRIRYDE